jgi:hypothetical protein
MYSRQLQAFGIFASAGCSGNRIALSGNQSKFDFDGFGKIEMRNGIQFAA